jgi:hypothetical protein
MLRRCLVVLSTALVAALATPAHGFDLVDGDQLKVDLAGYVQIASGVQRLGYELPLDLPSTSGFGAQVLRLQWGLQWSDWLTVDVHNRLFANVQSGAGGLNSTMGLGASITPNRTVDLSTTFLDESGVVLSHDIDRLAMRVFFDRGELIAGRQAITWGNGMLFPVADVWTTFSPFELDQTEKPGTDALRLLYYPAGTLELDVVLVDRGSLEDLSGGLKASLVLGSADVYLGAGKSYDRLLAMAGVAYDFVAFKLRAEIIEPFNLDEGAFELPRATIGADYLRGDWAFSGEYHFNGAGVTEPSDYLTHMGDPRFARGESYYLNRHYAGLIASYGGIDRLRISLGAMGNLADPSVILTPSIAYELSDNTDVAIGAFQGIGEHPSFDPFPNFRSEFGTYGAFYYTQIRGFF